nr:MAG TPA: hypothetical protein [Caudoviricetes sp.]
MQVAVGRLQRQSSLIRHQHELYIPVAYQTSDKQ